MKFIDTSFENSAPDFDDEGLKVPPWIKYPNIPLGSIGWRMGVGEGYWGCFVDWWKLQSEPVRLNVKVKYVAPIEWSNFYGGLKYYES